MSGAPRSSASLLKAFAVALASFIGALLLLAALLPALFQVDRFRAPLLARVNERLNGRMELGELHLSLWGRLAVEADGIRVVDARGREVIRARQVELRLPLLTVVSGVPAITVRIEQPEVLAIRDEDGRINLLSLWRPNEKKLRLPRVFANSRIGLDFHDAAVTYADRMGASSSRFAKLDVQVRDLSLQGTTTLRLKSELDARLENVGNFRGPLQATLHVTPTPGARGAALPILAIRGDFDCDFTSVAVTTPGLLEKKPGVPSRLSGRFDATPSEIRFTDVNARVLNATLVAEGRVTRLRLAPQSPGASPVPPVSPVLQGSIRSNAVELAPWADLLPLLRRYQPNGRAVVSARLEGPVDRLEYAAEISIRDAFARHPLLTDPVGVSLALKVATDRLESGELRLSAPGNDLRIRGSLASLTAPRGSFVVDSRGLDLDRLLKKSPSAPEEKTSASSATAEQADADALLDPIRSNSVASASRVSFSGTIPSLKTDGIQVSDMAIDGNVRDLVLSLDRISGKVWSGNLSGSAALDLRPGAPTYRFALEGTDLDLRQAAETRFEVLKKALLGRASFQLRGTGSSLSSDRAVRNAAVKGAFSVTDASFGNIDISKIAVDAVNGAIDKVASRVPALKGRKVSPDVLGENGPRSSRYQSIASSIVVSGGYIALPDFRAVAAKGAGIDVKGSMKVSLLGDHPIEARWEIIDTWDVLGAKGLGLEIAGHRIDHLLARDNGAVRFPVSVRGTLSEPRIVARDAPEYLASIAAGKVADVATGTLKKEADDLLKSAPPEVRKALNQLPELLRKK